MKRRDQGFTLIEVLIVISIIGLLSSVILAALSTTRTQASEAAVAENVQTISKALEFYYQDNNGTYPFSGSWLSLNTQWSSLLAVLSPYTKGALINTEFINYIGPYSSTYIVGSQCFITADGYVLLAFNAPPNLEANDGGIVPNLYEIYGGDAYRGTYNSAATTPSQRCK